MLENAEKENVQLQDNIRRLERQQDVLLQQFNSLRSDAGSVAVQARALNLYSPEDRVIQFHGVDSSSVLPGPGEMFLHERPAPYNETPLRIVSLSLGGLCLLFLTLRRSMHALKSR